MSIFKYDNGWKGRNHTSKTIEKMRLVNLGKKHTPETKEKIRLANSGKKFSNGFKGRKHTPETVEKIKLAIKGRKGRKQTPETKKKLSLLRLGKPRTDKVGSKGPQHYSSVVCKLRSPTGAVWCVKNLSHFIRTHPELFDPKDTVTRKYKTGGFYCSAISGLLKLTRITGPRKSWKGWTLISKVNNHKNKDKDSIGCVLTTQDNTQHPGQ